MVMKLVPADPTIAELEKQATELNRKPRKSANPVATGLIDCWRNQAWLPRNCRHKFLSALPRPPGGPYAVEKLTWEKFAEKTSRQVALQKILSARRDICYPQKLP